MKTQFLLLLSLTGVVSAPAFSQSRFSVGLTAAPLLNHGSIRQNIIVPDGSGQFTTLTFDNTSSTSGYSVGALAQYKLSPNWSVATGLWYRRTSISTVFPFSYSATGNAPTRAISFGWQVPLLLNYRSGTGRLSPLFSLGAVGSFGDKTTYRPAAGSGLSDVTINFNRKLTIQPMIGAGVAYRLTDRWSLTAQPLLIWRFRPRTRTGVTYDRFVSYQLQGQVRLLYSLR